MEGFVSAVVAAVGGVGFTFLDVLSTPSTCPRFQSPKAVTKEHLPTSNVVKAVVRNKSMGNSYSGVFPSILVM